jgi:putative ABC transport system permease protein
MNLGLWLRWSWRDLRKRWLQVAAIALIIALGTGIYAGLGSTTPWRMNANDASYALLNMYDLRVTPTRGSFINGDELLGAVQSIEHANWIQTAEPRLIISTLVDASTGDQVILVPGQILGVTVSDGGPHVNGIAINGGRALDAGDSGPNTAILEQKFAAYYDLPSEGSLRISGDIALNYVGTGVSPEYFMIITEDGGMMAEANFAALYVSLETAQTLAERPGMVNDLMLKLTEDADPDVVRAEVEQALTAFSGVGFAFTTAPDDEVYNMLHEDARTDGGFWNMLAIVFLAGATFGAFNLATRMVEAQRREIGIGMALGVPRRLIAIRPLLVALQISLLGVVFGLAAGAVVGAAFGDLLAEMMPMPVWEMPFQGRIFLEAALLGIVLPFIATLYPVWRALRVEPVDAIRTGHLVAKGGGWTRLVKQTRLPGRSFAQMPIRNLLRSPRRSLLTLFGVGAAIVTLIVVQGMLDSMLATLDDARDEILQDQPDRMIVDLNFFYPVNSSVVTAIQQSPVIAQSEPGLRLGGYLMHNGKTIETFLDMVNPDSTVWKPTVVEGKRSSDQPGVLLSEKAAKDLGVEVGQTITLKHPQREGLLSYGWVETEVEVLGIHALPMRFQTYMDIEQAKLMGLAGIVNNLQVIPAPGHTPDDVKQAMFRQAGVASVQPTNAVVKTFEDLLGMFVSMLFVIVVAAIGLAFLIAYNSTSINMDERSREMATMFAFGVRIRTVTRMAVVENLVLGVLGTTVGYFVGRMLFWWILDTKVSSQLADVGVVVTVAPTTLLTAVLIGVLVVALTPLLSIRRMVKMDLPSTLRVME